MSLKNTALADDKVSLPLFFATARGNFIGLPGAVFERDVPRKGMVLLVALRVTFALGGNGIAHGDGAVGWGVENIFE
jgi:hypothetical protein